MFVGDVRNEKGPMNIYPILERSFGQQIYPKYLAVIHQQETYDGYDSRQKSGLEICMHSLIVKAPGVC
jgi:hypothetical protein